MAFVASVEAKDYPFYATQYRPEKYVLDNDISESKLIMSSIAKNFVNKARENKNTFGL